MYFGPVGLFFWLYQFNLDIIHTHLQCKLKGIVHFEIIFRCVLAFLEGIQDVGVFVSAVVSILIFLGQTVL